MTDVAASAPPAPDRTAPPRTGPVIDTRRRLQLTLAAVWLLDGVLQLQPFMFTKGFAQNVVAPAGDGDPGWIASSITWSAHIIAGHPELTNAAFAGIQIAIGLGIAWRPLLRAALACSVLWGVFVWWFGEGLGGIFTGDDTLTGAPGGVILYALLSVLLWPAAQQSPPFAAAAAVGKRAAQILWLVLWGSGIYLTLQSTNTAPNAMHDSIAAMDAGQPHFLGVIDRHAAALVAGRGLAASIVSAIVIAAIALAVFLPPGRAMKALLVLGFAATAVIWVVGEGLGMVFGGQGTDPEGAPLLALLIAAYWPARRAVSGPRSPAAGPLEARA